MKQIPNFFTLLNLIFGCIAIVFILQTNESIVLIDETGGTSVTFPEKIWQGALFIFAAAIIDFLDGFLARMFKASSAMGKQLDSLSDVVSFGVAPGMILYQLLRIGWAREPDGLNIPIIALLPAFIFTAAVAWRLAKFNISPDQSNNFKGVPSPAAGLLVASFPLIIFYGYFGLQEYLINPWILYVIILALAFLMNTSRSFMTIKFNDFSLKNNLLTYILFGVGLVSILLLKWFAVPIIFIAYLVISMFAKESPTESHSNKETLDVMV